MSRKSILISGAGIAGPTLAYWLSKRGFEATIVERAPGFRTGGYMIDFWGVGFDVAKRMGLVPRLRQARYVIDHLKFVDQRNRVRSELGGELLTGALGDDFVSLPRGDLARIIFDQVEGRIETIFGDSVSAIEETPTAVEVTFEKARARQFDLVAGCDGLHSGVRALVFGPEKSFERYLGYYAASFVTDDYAPRDEHTYLSYSAPGRQISRYGLRGNRTAFFFIFLRQQKLDRSREEADGRRILHETFAGDKWEEIPEILRRLDRCDDLYFDSVSQIRMPRWSCGRSVLVGDAAYCPSLMAGAGSSFAMAGAYILAGELERAGGDFLSAFEAYEKKLRPFIERKQESALGFAGSFTPRTGFGLFVRDQVLRMANRFRPVSHWLMERFVSDHYSLPNYDSEEAAPGATRVGQKC
jgi:2-polyprenyl-6-methoxyphenol hydroxylase-like FAD-dependent oxidoreductase